jgi:serine/threonine-protein kinase
MTGTVRDVAPPARTVPLDPGEVVGEPPDSCWRVVRHVADGGFSSVYEVRPATPETVDRHGGAPRALKCLWGTPAELTAIGGEAAKTAAVDGHPGVLRLVTPFRFERSAPPHHYVGLVLELADEDLPTFGARVSPDERAWAAVFEQVAAGLEHIHARRVVHGDIKPTNVLRLGARFAVADFGVSAPLESTRSAGIGLARSIAFWPPESASQGVLLSDGVRRPPVEGWRASQGGDVWALAVSAHRMLTGRHITAGTTPEQQYELVCLGRYAVDGGIGAGWRRLLEDCLVHDPSRRRVTSAAELRERFAELAVPPAYAPAPWPAGSPRLAALLDLDPAAGGPLLALTLDRPCGRVSGSLLPADGVLPAAVRHLTDDVLPALAHRAAEPPAVTPATAADPAATQLVTTTELERTRQLAESVTRQRDRLAADRDRLTRARDDVAADRDRLRRDHEILARRLDRLEREAGLVAGAQGVAVAGAQRPAEATRVLAAPVRREPTRRYAPVMAQARSFDQPQPAVATGRSTSDRRWGRDRWAPAGPSAAEPEPPRAALRESALLSRLRRMLRRLVAVTLLFLAFVILGVVGASALFDTSPDRVVARVLLVLDQVRDGSG